MNKQSNINCPKCKKNNTKKRGIRSTQHRGKIQRYFCKNCNFSFIESNGFKRMRNSPKKITLSLDLFFRGLSTREIQNHLKAFYPHNSDHSTILRWIRKYSLLIAEFTDKLKVNTGSYIEVDEMEFHRRKSHKARLGIDKNWLINALDVKTRFLLCSNYAKNRNQRELKAVFKKVKDKSDNIKIVTTDGFMAYRNVIKKTWGYNLKALNYNIKHKVVNASRGEGFNIWVERLHNSLRQRTQGFRGFHGSLSSAYSIMKGIEIFYNFVRKHEALKGKTPSDVATNIEFKTPNRWLELITLSEKQ